jgi:2-octaprenyl-6-methoxyphenol hydroxylase
MQMMQRAEGPESPHGVEVVVVGGGPAGLTAAIALAIAGVETALVAPQGPHADNRTTALLAGSVRALEALGVWDMCRDYAAPLRGIRIIDDTRRLLRSREVLFDAEEIGVDVFGYNIENRHLLAALHARAALLAHLVRCNTTAETIDPREDSVNVTLAGGATLSAALVIGADGRNSRARVAARIRADALSYDQAALTMNLRHTTPHRDVSTEFHTETGPFTLVPLPGDRSSLVWVNRAAVARHLAKRSADAIAPLIELRSHSLLGAITVEGPRGVYRLGIQRARQLAAHRIALIGEAAHVIPPIGAQGLNLGLRDAAAIAEIIVSARRKGADAGGPGVMDQYRRVRRADVTTRTIAVDLLNRSLLSGLLPVQASRGLGLYLAERVGVFRRALMRGGMLPVLFEPRLMRGEPI